MSIDYKQLNSKLNQIIDGLINSHNINNKDIDNEKLDDLSYSESTLSNYKYHPIDTNREIKINLKNYQKLLSNNVILIEEIIKRI